MDFQGRAFYNLLRFNSIEDPAIRNYEKWQVEDYRSLTDQDLFLRLKKLGLALDLEAFLEIAKNFETPELLSEYLTPDETEVEMIDKIYLPLFELWRRFKKDCRSLSIFADELDLWMQVYDGQKEDVDDIIHSYLFELENFLDEAADAGKDPKEVFAYISSFFAHDIENFVYDFVYDLVEKESLVSASELIDAFIPYVKRETWFEYLRLRIFSRQDVEQFSFLVHRFAEKVLEMKDFELLLEVLDLMIDDSLIDLFFEFFRQGLSLITNSNQLKEMALILKDFYDSIEDHRKSQFVQSYLTVIAKKDFSKKLSKNDPLIEELSKLIG
jgi:hypothetical protein